MSIQSWYFCIQDEEKLWLWMCLRQVLMMCQFCLYCKLCSWCFYQFSGYSGIKAPRASPESPITIYIGERELACFLCLFHHPRSNFTKLLTRALVFGPCHCSYIFARCLTFRVQVAGDLNKIISFAVGVLTTSFARALLGLIH